MSVVHSHGSHKMTAVSSQFQMGSEKPITIISQTPYPSRWFIIWTCSFLKNGQTTPLETQTSTMSTCTVYN